MAGNKEIVGWFYRNGRRIPIFEKGQGKPNKVTSDGNTRDLADAAEKARGVQMDSADRDQIMRNPRSINGERVALYSGGKKESATFNMYSDGGKELINFKREPWPEGLRKNVKARDRKSRNEILEYDHDAAKAFEGIFDVESPREVANSMGKRVRTSDGKIVRPVKRSGIDMETRVNDSIGRNPEAYGITPESKVNDAVAESVGKELAGKPKRGGARKPKKDPNLLDANVPSYLKRSTGGQTPGYEGTETAFTDSRGERQWAKNVDSLPEKKNKFSNGYGKVGSTEKADIYADRDSTNGDYYAVPKSAGGKKPLATGKGSLRMNNNSEMRRRMMGTPGVPGKKKPTLGVGGKRRSVYDIPQRRAFAGKPIEESYIKYVMKEYGFSRADAIKLIKDKREGK